MQLQFALAGALAALALAPAAAHADYLYSPSAYYADHEGNGAAVTFNRIDSHKQWFFSGVTGTQPFAITGMSFRFNDSVSNASLQGGVFEFDDRFRIQISQLDGAPSTTFADNLIDPVTVLAGARDVPFVIGGVEGATKTFSVNLTFDTPYIYTPGSKYLVIDMFVPAQVNYGNFDFVESPFGGFRLHNIDGHAETGEIQYRLPVIRFDISYDPDLIARGNHPAGSVGGAIPEPATWLTMLLGFGVLGGVLRRRRADAGVTLAP